MKNNYFKYKKSDVYYVKNLKQDFVTADLK